MNYAKWNIFTLIIWLKDPGISKSYVKQKTMVNRSTLYCDFTVCVCGKINFWSPQPFHYLPHHWQACNIMELSFHLGNEMAMIQYFHQYCNQISTGKVKIFETVNFKYYCLITVFNLQECCGLPKQWRSHLHNHWWWSLPLHRQLTWLKVQEERMEHIYRKMLFLYITLFLSELWQ
jgi:hypothetical protein